MERDGADFVVFIQTSGSQRNPSWAVDSLLITDANLSPRIALTSREAIMPQVARVGSTRSLSQASYDQ